MGYHLRLVMTLAVGNGLLAMASVGQSEADVAQVPVLVLLLFENLDPHIWDGHGKPVIESYASQGQWHAESRHARDIFSNRNALWVEPM